MPSTFSERHLHEVAAEECANQRQNDIDGSARQLAYLVQNEFLYY